MTVLDPERLDKIRQHLRWHASGMTISDLASRLHMNRNLVAKYLDMLLISGQVEMKVTGTAKVYSLSSRVPVSAMLEFSSDSVIMLNEEQTIVYVNEPVLKLLNENRDTLVGRKPREIAHPFFRCLPEPQPVKNGEPADETITETSSVLNGKTRHFRVKQVPTAFEDGSQGATFIIEDITARKISEETLQMSEARYRGIVEDQTEFITRFRSDGTLVFVNDSYARFLGKKPAALLGSHLMPGINKDDGAELDRALESLDRNHAVTTIECRMSDELGRVRWICWTIRALFNESDNIHEYQGVGRDITDKKEASARISQYVRNLEFLARSSATFADMADDENIYQFIVDSIAQLEPKAHVVVMSINPDTKMTAMQAFAGDKEITQVAVQYFGDIFKDEISLEKAPEVWGDLAKGNLVKGTKSLGSLYVQMYRVFPEQLCNEVQERMAANTTYTMGCTCRMGIYGNIGIRFRHDDDLTSRETVEAFIRQAGVALQRRYLREKLRKAEERIKALECISSSAGQAKPSAQINNGTET
jgi:PAS domain S-box-containing protein